MAEHAVSVSTDDRPGSSSSGGGNSSSSPTTTTTTSLSQMPSTASSSSHVGTHPEATDVDLRKEARKTAFSPPISTMILHPPQSVTRPRLNDKRGSMNGPLYMQSGPNSRNMYLVRRRHGYKDEGMVKGFAKWLVENQIGLSSNLIALLFLTHMLVPKARQQTVKFFSMAYRNAATMEYGAGPDDAYIICFLIVLFTGIRALTMEHLLAPLGRRWGIKKTKIVTRFSEQAYMLLCYVLFWSVGMNIYVNSECYLDLSKIFTDWPERDISGTMKAYMLAQLAFWLQQVMVIFIEERRKDHWQMLSHHVITISLIVSCYCYHFTRVGNVILILMDPIDIIFPIAKCLKYVGQQMLCDIAFGVFIITWFVTRHIMYPMVVWAIYIYAPRSCHSGPASNLVGPIQTPSGYGYLIEPFIKQDGIVCCNFIVKWTFLGSILLLQGLLLLWFTMIIRVAVRILAGGSAHDVRSDGEDEGQEEEDEYEEVPAEAMLKCKPPMVIEQEVGVEAIDFKNWERRTGVNVKRSANASGVGLPGHSDRMELLGRIGCDSRVE